MWNANVLSKFSFWLHHTNGCTRINSNFQNSVSLIFAWEWISIAFQFLTRKVLGSHLYPETGFLTPFMVIHRSSKQMSQQYFKLLQDHFVIHGVPQKVRQNSGYCMSQFINIMRNSLYIIPNSLFTNHPAIRRYILVCHACETIARYTSKKQVTG